MIERKKHKGIRTDSVEEKSGNEKEMSLSERVYKCSCGIVLDRDHNSAINIKKEGLRLLELA